MRGYVKMDNMQNNSRRIFFFSIILTLLLTGCSISPSLTNTGLPARGSLPFFMDDFSDHANGWDLLLEQEAIVQYDGDSLRMQFLQPDMEFITTPGIRLSDGTVDVDAERVGGPTNNMFGLVCRYSPGSGYYAFLVSSDGYYAILKNINGSRTFISSDSFELTDAIVAGENRNHIQAVCEGPALALIINGVLVKQITDTDLTTGQAGIIAGSLQEPGTDMRFDNFIVFKQK